MYYYIYVDNNTSYPNGKPDKAENVALGPYRERSIASLAMADLMLAMRVFPAAYKDIRLDEELTWEVCHIDNCRSIGRAYIQEVIEAAE